MFEISVYNAGQHTSYICQQYNPVVPVLNQQLGDAIMRCYSRKHQQKRKSKMCHMQHYNESIHSTKCN